MAVLWYRQRHKKQINPDDDNIYMDMQPNLTANPTINPTNSEKLLYVELIN